MIFRNRPIWKANSGNWMRGRQRGIVSASGIVRSLLSLRMLAVSPSRGLDPDWASYEVVRVAVVRSEYWKRYVGESILD